MKTLILFDVDGTLTESRKFVKQNMIGTINKLKTLENTNIGIVGGSNFEKQIEQLGEDTLNLFDYVFSENGLVAFENKNGKLEPFHSNSITKYLGNNNFNKLINICLVELSKVACPVKTGTFIETRTGMINICPVGRSCNQLQRDEFDQLDKKHNYRTKLVDCVSEKWNQYRNENKDVAELSFSIGGQISVDVFPKGWDKTYCLQFVKDSYERILFFGDKTMKGGNDFEIYNHELTESYTVTSPEDTIEKLNKLFNL